MAVSLEMEDKEEPWFEDDWGSTVRQQVLKRTMITNEVRLAHSETEARLTDCCFLRQQDQGRLNYRQNLEGMFVVTNEAEKNKWNNSRGYGIHPGASRAF